MIIGLCTLIAVDELTVMTYVLETYELAVQQAEELCKGVLEPSERTERVSPHNGNRETFIKFESKRQLLHIQEMEVATGLLVVKL